MTVDEARLDLQRRQRLGMVEAVWGQHKSSEQIASILRSMRAAGELALVTRVSPDKAVAVMDALPTVEWHRDAGCLTDGSLPNPSQDVRVGVLSGGTSISQLTTEENEKAFHKYSILTGKKIPIDILLDKWISIWNVKLKGREQGYRYVKRFCDKFETTDQVSKTKLLQWCDYLINEQGLCRKTVRCILSPCKVYWEYLEINGHVKDNPFIGINLNKSNFRTERNPRQAFTRNEINFLHNELQKKSNQEPELFHLFQIGIYTGARIEEICLIRTKDVSENTIRIMESKTEAGIREIPIHSQISGLIKTLKHRSTDTYLIGNLKINRLGQRSASIGKKFGRLKTKLGFKKGVHVFHSIRKTFSTLLDQAGVQESIAADIVGHEKETMTYGLYSGGSSMAQMIEAIERVNYK